MRDPHLWCYRPSESVWGLVGDDGYGYRWTIWRRASPDKDIEFVEGGNTLTLDDAFGAQREHANALAFPPPPQPEGG